jgi:predicted dehydrogenase
MRMNRRSFLHSTAAAGMGLIMAGTASGQAEERKNEDINIALIGAGTQGEVLLNTFVRMGGKSGLRVKAVCDIWEELNLKRISGVLAKFGYQPNGYVDYQEMLAKESDLDAVIVATPDFCHAEQTIASLKAGLHVYCETPMSNKIEDARKMVQAAKETEKLLQIGHQRRSNARYIHCFENLMHGAKLLGRVTAANAQWNQPVQTDRGWPEKRKLSEDALKRYGYESMHQFKNWIWYKGLGAGPAVDFGVHQIDVINWFLGTAPKSITASGGTYYYDNETHQWYDTVMAILQYETEKGKVSAQFQSVTTNGYGGHFEVFMGDEGSLELSESLSRGGVYRSPQIRDWDKWVRLGFLGSEATQKVDEQGEEEEGVVNVQETKPPAKYDIPVELKDPHHKAHLENFFDAVRGKASLNCPAETAYASTVTALNINEAIESGRALGLKAEDLKL